MSVNAGQYESIHLETNSGRLRLLSGSCAEASVETPGDQSLIESETELSYVGKKDPADTALKLERVSILNMIHAAISEVGGHHMDCDSRGIADGPACKNDVRGRSGPSIADLIKDTQMNSTTYLMMSYEVLCKATVLKLMRDGQTKRAVTQLLE